MQQRASYGATAPSEFHDLDPALQAWLRKWEAETAIFGEDAEPQFGDEADSHPPGGLQLVRQLLQRLRDSGSRSHNSGSPEMDQEVEGPKHQLHCAKSLADHLKNHARVIKQERTKLLTLAAVPLPCALFLLVICWHESAFPFGPLSADGTVWTPLLHVLLLVPALLGGFVFVYHDILWVLCLILVVCGSICLAKATCFLPPPGAVALHADCAEELEAAAAEAKGQWTKVCRERALRGKGALQGKGEDGDDGAALPVLGDEAV